MYKQHKWIKNGVVERPPLQGKTVLSIQQYWYFSRRRGQERASCHPLFLLRVHASDSWRCRKPLKGPFHVFIVRSSPEDSLTTGTGCKVFLCSEYIIGKP